MHSYPHTHGLRPVFHVCVYICRTLDGLACDGVCVRVFLCMTVMRIGWLVGLFVRVVDKSYRRDSLPSCNRSCASRFPCLFFDFFLWDACVDLVFLVFAFMDRCGRHATRCLLQFSTAASVQMSRINAADMHPANSALSESPKPIHIPMHIQTDRLLFPTRHQIEHSPPESPHCDGARSAPWACAGRAHQVGPEGTPVAGGGEVPAAEGTVLGEHFLRQGHQGEGA